MLYFIENWATVQYPVLLSEAPVIHHDNQDGIWYKKQSGPGNFITKPEHAGLIIFVDGVPLFKSSVM